MSNIKTYHPVPTAAEQTAPIPSGVRSPFHYVHEICGSGIQGTMRCVVSRKTGITRGDSAVRGGRESETASLTICPLGWDNCRYNRAGVPTHVLAMRPGENIPRKRHEKSH